jgi:hypothetical protein
LVNRDLGVTILRRFQRISRLRLTDCEPLSGAFPKHFVTKVLRFRKTPILCAMAPAFAAMVQLLHLSDSSLTRPSFANASELANQKDRDARAGALADLNAFGSRAFVCGWASG